MSPAITAAARLLNDSVPRAADLRYATFTPICLGFEVVAGYEVDVWDDGADTIVAEVWLRGVNIIEMLDDKTVRNIGAELDRLLDGKAAEERDELAIDMMEVF